MTPIRRTFAASLVITATLAAAAGCTSGGRSSASSPSAGTAAASNEAPTRENTVDPTASPTPSPDTQAPAAEAAARSFAAAYLPRSYQDSGPTAWLNRVQPLATTELLAQLAPSVLTDAQWSTFVAARTVVRVVVSSAAVNTAFHGTDNLRLVTVGYTTTTTALATSAGQAASGQLRVMMTRTGDRWRANHLIS